MGQQRTRLVLFSNLRSKISNARVSEESCGGQAEPLTSLCFACVCLKPRWGGVE